jgi:hypothetical protein
VYLWWSLSSCVRQRLGVSSAQHPPSTHHHHYTRTYSLSSSIHHNLPPIRTTYTSIPTFATLPHSYPLLYLPSTPPLSPHTNDLVTRRPRPEHFASLPDTRVLSIRASTLLPTTTPHPPHPPHPPRPIHPTQHPLERPALPLRSRLAATSTPSSPRWPRINIQQSCPPHTPHLRPCPSLLQEDGPRPQTTGLTTRPLTLTRAACSPPRAPRRAAAARRVPHGKGN